MRVPLLTIGAWLALAAPSLAQTSAVTSDAPRQAKPKSAMAPIWREDLPDVPGKQLVVVPLRFPPGNSAKAPAHRHPGSVFVYVTKGEALLGLEGQQARVVAAGHGFFEPAGAIHNVSQSANSTEVAEGIAVMIIPDGAPLATVIKEPPAAH